jgi:uncharacterized protein (DUF488 family)
MEQFVGMLLRHEVREVADVRSSPYSRHTPQFNREILEQALRQAGIGYVFLGRELGARPDAPDCYQDGHVEFQRLRAAPRFEEGLRTVLDRGKTGRVALLCAEKDPVCCHRMILVSRALRSRVALVGHILADGSLETNEDAERRLVRLVGVERSLFEPDVTDAELVERAYDLQGQEIAYRQQTPEDAAVSTDLG